MRKIFKFTLLVIMIFGIAFSIFNLMSLETKAGNDPFGAWVYSDGTFRCMGDGSECIIDIGWQVH